MIRKFAAVMACILSMGAMGISTAQAGTVQWGDGFEFNGNGGWWFAGNAGIDHGIGLAHWGNNNGWVRNWDPNVWNAVNTNLPTVAGEWCTVSVWIRASANLQNGDIAVRSWRDGLPGLNSIHLAATPGGYNRYEFSFVADSHHALFYAGFWGTGQDQWIQVDDLHITCNNPWGLRGASQPADELQPSTDELQPSTDELQPSTDELQSPADEQ